MADVCEGYSFLLAAEDVVPIALGAIGFFALARRITAGVPQISRWAYAAASLLVVGSAIAGPLRKALIAGGADCAPLEWMQAPFFLVLPVGFALLAWAVRAVLSGRVPSFWPYAAILALTYAGAVAAERAVILFGVGGLFAVATGIECAVLARRQADTPTAVLFILYCIATLGLPALGSNSDRSAVLNQWLEQGTNTFAQLLFAIAALRLARRSVTPANTPVATST